MGDAEKTEITELLLEIDKKQVARHDEVHRRVIAIDDLLRGTYEKKGLITRVAGLEQTEAERKCWYKITVGAAVTSAVGAIVSWFKHNGGA